MTVGGNQSVYFENKETSDDSNVYAAVEFLFNLGYARNSYSYTNENSVTHNYGASTCAVLSAGTASTFINDYDTIHGTLSGAGVLDNTGMFVYDVDNGKVSDDLSKNVAISVIVNELRKHVSNNQTPIQGASIAITNGTDTTTVALVVTVATAVVVGSFFFLRKKKEQ